jgi:hypothetical protein
MKVGDTCYTDKVVGEYRGTEDGKHLVLQRDDARGVETMHRTDHEPLVPQALAGTYWRGPRDRVIRVFGHWCWLRDNRPCMYARFTEPAASDRDSDCIRESELLEKWQAIECPFLPDEEVRRLLDEIGGQLEPIQARIDAAREELRLAERALAPIRERCEHEWEREEEVEGAMNMLGRSCSRETTCTKCGLEKTDYYTKFV